MEEEKYIGDFVEEEKLSHLCPYQNKDCDPTLNVCEDCPLEQVGEL